MIKIIALATLVSSLTVDSAAAATWVKILEDAESTRYVDADTIRSEGTTVNMWQMTDYRKNPDGDPYLSAKFQTEFDCRGKRVRSLHLVTYAGNMGHGQVFQNSALGAGWTPLVPGSVDEGIARHVACKAR